MGCMGREEDQRSKWGLKWLPDLTGLSSAKHGWGDRKGQRGMVTGVSALLWRPLSPLVWVTTRIVKFSISCIFKISPQTIHVRNIFHW